MSNPDPNETDPATEPAGAEPRPPLDASAASRLFSDMFRALDDSDATLSFEVDPPSRRLGRRLAEREDDYRSYLERRVESLRDQLLGARVGSCDILEEIGRGGMGIVFKARQESPMFTREIAMKFMLSNPDARSDDRERFMNEVKGLARLSHPSLVPLFDSGIERDLYYFSMELVDGHALTDRDALEPLSLDDRLRIVRDIALALEYLHTEGVIHRDVKPGNIMIDRSGNARLLDFGIAQFSTEARRRVAQAGSPFYMAPEVIDPRGSYGPIGPGTDIYALGAVLYRLLVGREVFGGDGDISRIFADTLSAPPEFPQERSKRIPAGVETIIRRCLRKRVDERYASAAELADDIAAFLDRGRQRPARRLTAATLVLGCATVLGVTLQHGESDGRAPRENAPDPAAIVRSELDEIQLDDLLGAHLSEEDLAAVEQRFGATREAILAVEGPEALSAYRRAIDQFWADEVDRARDRAEAARAKAKEEGADLVESSAAEWKSGATLLANASHRGWRDDVALLQVVRAEASFRAATDEARRQIEREREERAASRAEAAALRSQGRVNADLLRFSPEAESTFADAERALEEGQAAARRGSSEEAVKLFVRAEGAYDAASDLGVAAERRFRTERSALAERLFRWTSAVRRAREHLSLNFEARLEEFDREEKGMLELSDQLDSTPRADLLTELATRVSDAEEALGEAKSTLARLREEADAARTRNEHDSRFSARYPAEPAIAREHLRRARSARTQSEEYWSAGAFRRSLASAALARSSLDEAWRLRATALEGMIWIDGGESGGQRIDGFWIDAAEVTVADVLAWIEREPTGAEGRSPRGWKEQTGTPRRPVVGVPYEYALAFAAAHGKSLPTLREWRRAVGVWGPTEPWRDRLVAVRPARRPKRCVFLIGNAAEWVRPEDGRSEPRLVGGSYLTAERRFLRADDPGVPASEVTDATLRAVAGFRCLLRPAEETAP